MYLGTHTCAHVYGMYKKKERVVPVLSTLKLTLFLRYTTKVDEQWLPHRSFYCNYPHRNIPTKWTNPFLHYSSLIVFFVLGAIVYCSCCFFSFSYSFSFSFSSFHYRLCVSFHQCVLRWRLLPSLCSLRYLFGQHDRHPKREAQWKEVAVQILFWPHTHNLEKKQTIVKKTILRNMEMGQTKNIS